ncbi:MAG: CapA family protein [Alphaproteobacteria bacterium]|nr:CapA family protein [Alphaproteobacteria bacterium]
MLLRVVASVVVVALAAPFVRADGETQITVVLAGDTGLNGSFQPVYASHGTKHGMRLAWGDATALIAREINGDLNFANLETVVTDRNDLTPNLKLFGFRTHPSGVKHLMQIGFNVFSTANNHSMDFGLDGARDTLKALNGIGVAHVGLGENRTAARTPRLMILKGRSFAFGAAGIIGSGYGAPAEGEERVGHLSASDRDLGEATGALAATAADYRVLSVHYGAEFEVNVSARDRARLTAALAQGADLIAGHHHHVVNAVEMIGGKPVFYGLGNFLHWGTQDMSRFDMCRDYGLVARVHLAAVPGERLTVRAIEALPVTQMHKTPRLMSGEEGAARIHALNHLASKLGPTGVRFAPQSDGTGLHCVPGAERLTGPIGARCAAKPAITAPTPDLATKIAAACSKKVMRIVENEAGEAEPEFANVDHELPTPVIPMPF